MSSPLEVTAQVRVQAGAERVWQAATDWSRQGDWIWATRVHGGQGVGAPVTGWTGLGPVGFTDTMVITEWDPPRRCVVEHTGRVIRGAGIFEVRADGAECEFRWTEDLRLPLPAWLGSLVAGLVRPLAEWALASSLRRFARQF
ncbi:MAG TPA: SRPBCC family protein [Streptosporangiaceae bacterium]|nr:SRPBCC family protein [Streptosporangiaceae bacterium]